MDLLQYMNKNYYLLVPALWVIGFALKQTPHVPDWSIIWILILAALSLATFAFGINYEAILNGIIASGIAVLGHQYFIQRIIIKKTDKKKQRPKKDNDLKK
ncbi:MAG: phage holin family protein [Bacillota bacterium]|nr:phage holin family protein [Bacillota bacterium]